MSNDHVHPVMKNILEAHGVARTTETHKHTPGPWKVYRDHPSTPSIRYIRTGDGLYEGEIATMYGSDGSDADALLIAAAPDLLAALKLLTQDLKGYSEWERPTYAMNEALKAIAKAEGRS